MANIMQIHVFLWQAYVCCTNKSVSKHCDANGHFIVGLIVGPLLGGEYITCMWFWQRFSFWYGLGGHILAFYKYIPADDGPTLKQHWFVLLRGVGIYPSVPIQLEWSHPGVSSLFIQLQNFINFIAIFNIKFLGTQGLATPFRCTR